MAEYQITVLLTLASLHELHGSHPSTLSHLSLLIHVQELHCECVAACVCLCVWLFPHKYILYIQYIQYIVGHILTWPHVIYPHVKIVPMSSTHWEIYKFGGKESTNIK